MAQSQGAHVNSRAVSGHRGALSFVSCTRTSVPLELPVNLTGCLLQFPSVVASGAPSKCLAD